MSELRSIVSRTWVQHLLVFAVLSALLLPNMDMGLYDPWETHYAETARRSDVHGDWITLRWHADSRLGDQVNRQCRHDPEQCYFFSKPVLIFWLMAASFRFLGVSDWAARGPITLWGICGVFLIYLLLRRSFGLRAGLIAAAALITTPFYYLLSRQIMTDIGFVAPMSVGLVSIAYFFSFEKAPKRYLYLFYAMAGLATLAKGLLGFLLPGAVIFVFLLTSPWHFVARLKRAEIHKGILITLAVAAPWYLAVWHINGETWFNEFIVKHHFQRAGGGVHGERGGWDYFVDQLGYGLWPWLALVPVGLAFGLLGLRKFKRPFGGQEGMRLFLAVWAIVAFVVFSASKTKFHHYIFPAVPPLILLSALFLDKALKKGTILFEKAMLVVGGGLMAWVTTMLLEAPYSFINLFIYNYDRRYPEVEEAGTWLIAVAGIAGLGVAALLVKKLIPPATACLVVAGFVGAGWNVHGYMMELETTLSQRDAFEAWERLRQPGDRLYEWALRWRGEVWYSRDNCHEIRQRSNSDMRRKLGRQGRAFVVTTSPGALSRKTRRLFGRPVKVVNENPVRYAMTEWEGPPEGSRDRYLVRSVPPSATEVNAELGGSIKLLAYRLRPETVSPGDTVELTLYFETSRSIGREWTVFVHGDNEEAGRPNRLLSDHPPADGIVPTTSWRAGQIVRDISEMSVRRSQPPGEYQFWVGLFREDGRRMRVRSGPSDEQNRVRLGAVTVEE